MKSYSELIDLVAAMREAQNEYFKYRTQSLLDKAKKLEAKIDKLVKEELSSRVVQQDLFNEQKS